MSILKRDDGTYEVRVTKLIKGKEIERRKRGIQSKGDARYVEVEFERELFQMKEKGWTKKLTWADALIEYSQWKKTKVRYSTWASAVGVLKLHTSVWNEKTLESFKTVEVESLIENAYDEENTESKRKLLGYIKDAFMRQIQHGHITKNPCDELKYGKGAEKELIAMSRTEIIHLLDQARRTQHPWYAIWRVVYEFGLRSGEGLALKWTDIDFANRRVSINKSYCSKSKTIGPTKNRKVRMLVINPALASFLKELKLASPDREHVLPQLTEWKRGEAAETLRAFQRDLRMRETNFHSLRASFITHLLLNGVAITKVQHMVGHSDLKTTMRYHRLIAADLDGATDSLAMEFSEEKIAVILPIFKET